MKIFLMSLIHPLTPTPHPRKKLLEIYFETVSGICSYEMTAIFLYFLNRDFLQNHSTLYPKLSDFDVKMILNIYFYYSKKT